MVRHMTMPSTFIRMSLFDFVCHTSAAIVFFSSVWFLQELLFCGVPALSWSFLTASPEDFGRAGGVSPFIVATLWIILLTSFIVVPIGFGAAVFLTEFVSPQSQFRKLMERAISILAGMPSIAFGLCGYSFFCQTCGLRVSLLSGALTLACMVLPLFVRCVVDGILVVSEEDRLLAAALNLSQWSKLRYVILPRASAAVSAAMVISLARAGAETSALIYTTGYMPRWPSHPLDAGRPLSVHVCELAMNVPGAERNAFGAAVVLVAVVTIATVISRLIFPQHRPI